MQWKESFIFQQKPLYYNKVPYNNQGERAVEIPIALDFIASIQNKSKLLEIGNVLSNYENFLTEDIGIKPRRIVDKYEVAAGVDNIDLMDLPDSEKYDVIVAISTVEHVGQEYNIEGNKFHDFEAPLKAIAKIYNLLSIGGKALITVPFGKLLYFAEGESIQFSKEYLDLLSTKYQIPSNAICKNWLKRISFELGVENPRQMWIQREVAEFSNMEYHWPWPYANGVAIIEMTKISDSFILNLNLPLEPWNYNIPLIQTISSDLIPKTYSILESFRNFNIIIFPNWSELDYILYADLEQILQSLFAHPDKNALALLIDTSNIAIEDASHILSEIVLNLENINIEDQPEIRLLGEIDPLQWDVLLPRIDSRVILEAENEVVVTTVGAKALPSCTVDDFSSKRVIQLESGASMFG